MNWVIFTFDDLIFKTDKITKLRKATIEEFVNGYGVCVEETHEGYNMVVLKNKIEYDKTHLQKNKMLKLNKHQITEYMKQIQKFGRELY